LFWSEAVSVFLVAEEFAEDVDSLGFSHEGSHGYDHDDQLGFSHDGSQGFDHDDQLGFSHDGSQGFDHDDLLGFACDVSQGFAPLCFAHYDPLGFGHDDSQAFADDETQASALDYSQAFAHLDSQALLMMIPKVFWDKAPVVVFILVEKRLAAKMPFRGRPIIPVVQD